MSTAQPIKDPEILRDLMDVYERGTKNHLLLAYALNTGLRVSDILTANVTDSLKGVWTGNEQKTGKAKTIPLNSALQLLIRDYIDKHELKQGDPLFYSNKDKSKAISRVQAYRIIEKAGDMIGIKLSPHSLRKTFGYMHYKNTKDVALLMDVFNHSSASVTLRYIGINEETIERKIYSNSIGI